MCGIVGYSGCEDAPDILFDLLSKLEYRGYDSAGIAVFSKEGIKTLKKKGRVNDLIKSFRKEEFGGFCGIGHTRWATHGAPNDVNAHPHSTSKISLVHNGIIENYLDLKEELIECGYLFLSETDSEVIAKLLDRSYRRLRNPFFALVETVKRLKGSYALGIIFKDYPDKIFAIKKDCPLICAIQNNGSFLSSDVSVIMDDTDSYFSLDENEIAVLCYNAIDFFDFNGELIQKEISCFNQMRERVDKGPYEHFMLKEIFEQPKIYRRTLSQWLNQNGEIKKINFNGFDQNDLKGVKRIVFVACGTAMHASYVGKNIVEKLGKVTCCVEIASEFRYREPLLFPDDLVIFVSQSGETADTLEALRMVKRMGIRTLGIVNAFGSAIAREADRVIYTQAGPEIAVASTKAFTMQLLALYAFAIAFADANQRISDKKRVDLFNVLENDIPKKIEDVLSLEHEVKHLANYISGFDNLFFIGRGLDYLIAMEASLKLKEVSYIHCEAYAAGELKHGSIALIDEKFPTVAICSSESLSKKILSNIKEINARGGIVSYIGKVGIGCDKECERRITLPECDDLFSPILLAPIIQMLAYYAAIFKKRDVDKPRNLAKSVTVE